MVIILKVIYQKNKEIKIIIRIKSSLNKKTIKTIFDLLFKIINILNI